MMKRNTYLFKGLLILVLGTLIQSCTTQTNSKNADIIKVALRDVGHQLLLNNQDSTSRVKPIIALEEFKYQIAFENHLIIHPDSLVRIMTNSFKKANVSQHYLTEVLQCKDPQVAYSYQMKATIEKGMVPCIGRVLEKGCYTITVKFTKAPKPMVTARDSLLWVLAAGFVLLAVVLYKKNAKTTHTPTNENYEVIGHYKFYPEQNKLIKEALEISLSKKECELLAIFIAHPNQIVTRDTLTKKVWEDKGVIVGRSLDTYISKLRKLLQDDDSIKLTNVHGVGYKLEC
ncbi:helix-turn-helix domain-containing protein [Lacinutrix sp. Hel_I_90]|uniref:helix-turn-helix domain-containing protein n=1 Tax=Lacinutrix sp. Hel_I_90 TaxID=1249999 RepID=UPI0005C92A1C|nr:helix-turn-helix domain-containing protein [Lacinutrix sp. Hel_I_90]